MADNTARFSRVPIHKVYEFQPFANELRLNWHSFAAVHFVAAHSHRIMRLLSDARKPPLNQKMGNTWLPDASIRTMRSKSCYTAACLQFDFLI